MRFTSLTEQETICLFLPDYYLHTFYIYPFKNIGAATENKQVSKTVFHNKKIWFFSKVVGEKVLRVKRFTVD